MKERERERSPPKVWKVPLAEIGKTAEGVDFIVQEYCFAHIYLNLSI